MIQSKQCFEHIPANLLNLNYSKNEFRGGGTLV